MKKAITIRQVYAFCFLLLFTLSITPKIYFHAAIANHEDDVTVCNHPEKSKICLHQRGYNCQANDPVISSPYVLTTIAERWPPKINFNTTSASFYSSYFQDCLILKESRGPPMV